MTGSAKKLEQNLSEFSEVNRLQLNSEHKKRSRSPSESSDSMNTPLSTENKRQLIPAFPSETKPNDKVRSQGG